MTTRHLALVTPTATAWTRHDTADELAQAIMATPHGGDTVELRVGPRRYTLHHWRITDHHHDRLTVAWSPRIDLPPLQPPLRWRIQHALTRWWNQ